MNTTTLSLGQKLFRLRSLTPLPVIAFCLWVLSRSQGEVPVYGAVFPAVGIAVALLGQAVRYFTLGWVPEGSSGQNLTIQATTLNTRGPYSYVRNPLYVGNLCIVVGLFCVVDDWLVALVGLGFFFGEYFFIIRAEEAYLRSRFPEAFEAFSARVPRWVPRVTPAFDQGRLRDGRFDWRRALKKEINPFSAWVSGAVGVLLWQRWANGSLESRTSLVLVGLWSVTLLALLVIKAWKKGWLF